MKKIGLFFCVSFLSGLGWALSFAPANLWWLAPFALIPSLYVCLKYKASPTQAFLMGFLSAFTALLSIFQWMLFLYQWVSVGWLIAVWVIFSAYQAAFYGLVWFCFVKLYRSPRDMLLFPFLWAAFEWLRSLGPVGNTGGVLALPMAHFLPVLQIASYLGMFGVSWALLMFGGWITLLLLHFKHKYCWGGLAIVMGVLILGNESISPKEEAPLKIAIIQGNHSQQEKLNFFSNITIKQTYLDLTRTALMNYSPSIVVWPETFTPELNLEDEGFIRTLNRLCTLYDAAIIFGTPTRKGPSFFNSAVIAESKTIHVYNKIKLMPFGEYWPFRSALTALGLSQVVGTADFSPGTLLTSLNCRSYPVAPLICLESIFPQLSRQHVLKNHSRFFIVQANSAWFLNSNAAEEHFQMAQFRAVETDRYVIQASNTGISGIIEPSGKIQAQSKLNERTLLIGKIQPRDTRTVYVRFGEWWLVGMGLVLCCFFILGDGLHLKFKSKLR
jgi:apolipoprotein N-acyltransferase